GGWNYLIDAVLQVPGVKEMHLRRLRTVMDELLQPPGTPADQLRFEKRLDELYAQIAADPELLASAPRLSRGIRDIKQRYLAPRREHLYVHHSGDPSYPDFAGIPPAQDERPKVEFKEVNLTAQTPYVVLSNPGDGAIDLSRWELLVGKAAWPLPPGTLLPPRGTLCLCTDLRAFYRRADEASASAFVIGGFKRPAVGGASAGLELKTSRGAVVATR
ncbi:MAG TPA: hypothetical protein VH475_02220, partial [Tepidisphaeraceae bacterium]